MAWTHLLSLGGSMSNPFDYREVMKAQMRFATTKTVEEVHAEQKARSSRRGPNRSPSKPAGPPQPGRVTQTEVDKVRAMLGNRAPAPVAE